MLCPTIAFTDTYKCRITAAFTCARAHTHTRRSLDVTHRAGTQYADPSLTDTKDVKIKALVHFLVNQLIGKAIKANVSSHTQSPHAVPLGNATRGKHVRKTYKKWLECFPGHGIHRVRGLPVLSSRYKLTSLDYTLRRPLTLSCGLGTLAIGLSPLPNTMGSGLRK